MPNHHISTLEFRSLSGAPASLTLSASDYGDIFMRAAAQAGGHEIAGYFGEPANVSDHPAYARLRAVGASHCAMIGAAVIALDASTAATIDAAIHKARSRAREIADEQVAIRATKIRAEHDVRLTLSYAPHWQPHYEITESYPLTESGAMRAPLPGAETIVIHDDCPALTAVRARSEAAGSYAGHENYLCLVSAADRDLLIAETRVLNARDSVRRLEADAADARRLDHLRAIDVPEEAIVVFCRYRGDPDAAWEAEDDGGAALIRRFGAAIEAQGLAYAPIPRDTAEIPPEGA